MLTIPAPDTAAPFRGVLISLRMPAVPTGSRSWPPCGHRHASEAHPSFSRFARVRSDCPRSHAPRSTPRSGSSPLRDHQAARASPPGPPGRHIGLFRCRRRPGAPPVRGGSAERPPRWHRPRARPRPLWSRRVPCGRPSQGVRRCTGDVQYRMYRREMRSRDVPSLPLSAGEGVGVGRVDSVRVSV